MRRFCLVRFQVTEIPFYFVMNTQEVVYSKNIEIYEEENLELEDYYTIKNNLVNSSIKWSDLRSKKLIYK